MRLPAAFLVCLALLAGLSGPAWGQVLYGSLVGNVTDPSGAAVPQARVTATHKETGQVRETLTNEAGQYSFPTIQTGTYELKVTKEGFRTFGRSGVPISLNVVSRVDIVLELGTVTETVTVTGEAAVLQADTAQVKAELARTQLENLPVPPGRNYQNLFRLLPGFRPPTNAHSVPTNPSRALTFNVNGVSYSINNTRIDGASNNNPWLPHITSFVPTLESIEAVNVVTNSFDAEQGLAGGAAINVQIKSGTNELHGSLFEYHTNSRTAAKPFFLPQGERNPKLVNNEFGGTLGGPIRRDKVFYFVSYEGSLNREFARRFGTVPTAAMKRGDMSEALRGSSPRLIYDPLTGDFQGRNRTPFPNNIIPADRISPITRKLADLTPLPNVPGVLDTFATNNFLAGASYLFDRHRADSKINWLVNEKLTLFGRYSILNYDMINPEMFGALGGPEISGAGGNPGKGFGRTHSLTFAGTYLLGPRVVLDAHFGWTQFGTAVEQSRLHEKLGLDFLGIPGTNGPRRFEGGWPRFSVSGFTNLGINNAFMPYFRRDPQFQYVANLSWTRSSHEFRFGFDFYKTEMNHTQPEAPGALHGAQGGFSFAGGPTALNGGPAPNEFNAYSTFLLGLSTGIGKINQVPDEYNTRQWNYSWYFRDRWSATRRLTFTYGVRWEYYPFPTRVGRGLERYDFRNNKMLVCGVGQVPEDCGVDVSRKLFAPRVGVAYRATDTFVIRAGYGISYDPFSLQRPFRTNYPVLLILNITPENSFQPAGRIENGIPPIVPPSLGNGVIDIPGTFVAITVDDKFRRGYVQSWNFTLQKQLPHGFTAQAGYVATRSVRQLLYLDINAGQVPGAGQAGRPLRQAFGRTAETTLVTPAGRTQYDSLQATLERRFSGGWQVGATYTWSKVIGFNVNSDSGPNGTNALVFFRENRTVLNYDRPHMLNITAVWDLPFGRGQRWLNQGGVASWVLGGWQVNNLLSFYSGTPFTVTAPGTSLNLPGTTQRADQIKPTVKKIGGAGRGQFFYDPTAFAAVTDVRLGTAGYMSLRGPGIVNWDFSVFRRFTLSEQWKLEFRMESFNFTNTPHFANPDGSVTSRNFMQILNTTNLGRDGVDARQFRFGLRLSF